MPKAPRKSDILRCLRDRSAQERMNTSESIGRALLICLSKPGRAGRFCRGLQAEGGRLVVLAAGQYIEQGGSASSLAWNTVRQSKTRSSGSAALNCSGYQLPSTDQVPHDGVRVSRIIDVESVMIRHGIIGCDGLYRVDGTVPIGKEVVEVYGVPQTTPWKEELPWHVSDWLQGHQSSRSPYVAPRRV